MVEGLGPRFQEDSMRRFTPFALLTLLCLAGASQVQGQVNVTGTWALSWETQRGATTSTFTFVQEEAAFTGTAQMTMGGPPGGGGGGTREVEITDGKVEGNRVTFSMPMRRGDQTMSFTFSATVTGDAMEGTMTTPRGETPFKGIKK